MGGLFSISLVKLSTRIIEKYNPTLWLMKIIFGKLIG